MNFLLTSFLNEEDGAITVDWVVLTAAIVGLGLAVLAAVGDGTMSLADRLGLLLGQMTISTY